MKARPFSVAAVSADVHPKLTWKKCTKAGCTHQNDGVVIDSEWRDVVDDHGRSCLHDGCFDTAVCANEAECTSK
jgi:cellulose 1,4-beta-cellobiosidase